MGKYFNKPNKKINEDEAELITFNDFLKFKGESQINLVIKEMINNYMEGDNVTKNKDNKKFTLTKVPKRTGDYETDYANITDYLEELCTLYLRTEPDDEFDKDNTKFIFNYFDEDVKMNNDKKNIDFSETFEKAIIKKYLPVEFDQKANTLNLEKAIQLKPEDRYEAFKDFKQTWTRRNKREEPKWYEFGKRYRNYKEKKALDKYEEYLKKYGITDNLINAAKEGKMVSKDKFNNWKVKTYKETFEKYNASINHYDSLFQNANNFSKSQAIQYIELIIEYRKIEQDHNITVPGDDEFSKKSYNEIDDRLEREKENLISYMNLRKDKLKDTYKNLFEVASINNLKELVNSFDNGKVEDQTNFVWEIDDRLKRIVRGNMEIETADEDDEERRKEIQNYKGEVSVSQEQENSL